MATRKAGIHSWISCWKRSSCTESTNNGNHAHVSIYNCSDKGRYIGFWSVVHPTNSWIAWYEAAHCFPNCTQD